jgi:predicted MarR family transcription regulator
MSKEGAGKHSFLDKQWHLAQTEQEVRFTDFEFALFRVAAAFERWQKDCLAACVEEPMSGMDNSILHMIRMHERPKSISDIARLLNRDDLSNLQYSLRKLASNGLVERAGKKESKRTATYQVTAKGKEVTDLYREFRRELLMPLTESIKDFEGDVETTCRILNLISGIYDHAASIAAAHPRGDMVSAE